MTDTDQKLEDDVLRRMLATPPTPHKAKAARLSSQKMRGQHCDEQGAEKYPEGDA